MEIKDTIEDFCMILKVDNIQLGDTSLQFSYTSNGVKLRILNTCCAYGEEPLDYSENLIEIHEITNLISSLTAFRNILLGQELPENASL